MKKDLFAIALAAVFTTGAAAQTTTTITTQTCNVALSDCTMTDSAGDAIEVTGQWVYSGPVTVYVTPPGGARVARAGTATRTLVSQSTYKIVDDLVITCTDGTTLSGTYTQTRSGSGRGGWAWHSHVMFDTLVQY